MLEVQASPAGYEFHHLGYATVSIERERRFFSMLGYCPEGPVFEDNVQGVRGCFMVGDGPRVELLENLPGRGTLDPWLQSKARIYHLAYLVDNVLDAVDWAHGNGGKLLGRPAPAVAFDGRLIAFVIYRNRMVQELISRPVKVGT